MMAVERLSLGARIGLAWRHLRRAEPSPHIKAVLEAKALMDDARKNLDSASNKIGHVVRNMQRQRDPAPKKKCSPRRKAAP